jgi:hypothetical protein
MMIHRAISKTSGHNMSSFYHSLSLVELIKRIVEAGDRQALEEFHNNRTVFCFKYGRPLRFIEYLNRLRESAIRMRWQSCSSFEIADKAFDMTLDKFNNLPNETKSYASEGKKISNIVKQKGSNCRLYFKAFLDRANKSFSTKLPTGELEKETRASTIIQGFVRRHFELSLLEAERNSNPFWSRYYWNIKNCNICVRLPVSLKGRKRREWLEQNIENVDLRRPQERQRIQAIINRKLVRERFVPYNEAIEIGHDEIFLIQIDWKKTSGMSLAQIVAEEKVLNIQQQRPSIRALGETQLRKMILQIFEDISYDDYKDSKIAKDFGLTKATYSRFAGSRWQQSESDVPDLWRNTAQVLKDHSIFRQVAQEMGLWDQVVTTVKKSTFLKGKPKTNE